MVQEFRWLQLFVSVCQILEAEKTIRLIALLKFSRLSLDEIREFLEVESSQQVPHEEDSCIVFYIAGCFAQSISKSLKCTSCASMIKEDGGISVSFEVNYSDVAEEKEARERFLNEINRGGLVRPSELFFIACMHTWSFYYQVKEDNNARKFLLSRPEPRQVSVAAVTMELSSSGETESLLNKMLKRAQFQAYFPAAGPKNV